MRDLSRVTPRSFNVSDRSTDDPFLDVYISSSFYIHGCALMGSRSPTDHAHGLSSRHRCLGIMVEWRSSPFREFIFRRSISSATQFPLSYSVLGLHPGNPQTTSASCQSLCYISSGLGARHLFILRLQLTKTNGFIRSLWIRVLTPPMGFPTSLLVVVICRRRLLSSMIQRFPVIIPSMVGS
jgi:hypothetical protein